MFNLGPVQLESNLLLAPIAGYCDLPTRLLVRSIPGIELEDGTRAPSLGIACTDLICPQAVLRENERSLWLAAIHPDEKPVTMQLYGRFPESLNPAAEWAVEHGADVVDLNMGCPVDKVTKKNGGSKLLTEPCLAIEILTGLAKTLEGTGVPLTAKIRLGWCDESLIVDSLPERLADAGVVAVTVHGRTTAQKFRGSVQLDGITRVVENVKKRHPDVKVIGNGDVKKPEDAKRMLDVTGCDGVMIGRGALSQPWIFRDTGYYLATGKLPEPLPRIERAKLVLQHFDWLRQFRSDKYALGKFQPRVSWYSQHLQPWPGLRHNVRQFKEADALRNYLIEGIETIAQTDGVPAS